MKKLTVVLAMAVVSLVTLMALPAMAQPYVTTAQGAAAVAPSAAVTPPAAFPFTGGNLELIAGIMGAVLIATSIGGKYLSRKKGL